MSKRPISLAIVGWVFVATGCVSLLHGGLQLAGNLSNGTSTQGVGWVLGSGALAALGGAFLLRGANWARWLCAAWMGAHVVLSLFHSTAELIVHAVFFAAIVAALWRPGVSAYLAPSSRGETQPRP